MNIKGHLPVLYETGRKMPEDNKIENASEAGTLQNKDYDHVSNIYFFDSWEPEKECHSKMW